MTRPLLHRFDPPPGSSGIGAAIDKVRAAILAAQNEVTRAYVDRISTVFDELVTSYASEARSAPRTARERRFWDRTYQKGPHLLWTGMGRDRADGVPVCDWVTPDGRTVRTTAARVVWLLETRQDVPQDRYLRKVCDEPRCIARLCHELANSTPSGGRRPSAYYYDAQGQARCKIGHPIRDPRTGIRVYCPTCYQIQREALRAAQAAVENARARTRGIQRVPVVHNDPPEWQALMARQSRFVDWLAEAHPDANPLDLTAEQEDRFQREYKQSLPPSGSDSKPSQPTAPTDSAFLDEINAMFDEADS